MIYQLEQDTPSYLCDRTDRLHPWAAVRLCQEVTEYHSNSLGVGFENLVKQNRAWVIIRSYYEFLRRPEAYEKVMLNTWPRGNDGLFAFRDYKVVSESGEVLLNGTSYWTLIDYSNRRAMRLKDFINAYEAHDELATGREKLDRLRTPQFDDSDFVFSMQARNSIIDHTGHVNNSEYIKIIFDALEPFGFDCDLPFSLELNFLHETKPGDTLSVFVHRDSEIYYSQITNSQGQSVTACIKHI